MPISNFIPTPRAESLSGPLRAALYARTSRDPKKRATSTKDQMEMNRRECHYRDWVAVKEFVDDGLSASAKARKVRDDYEEMIRLVESGGCDVIVATETSRLLRDLEIYLHLRKLCRLRGVLWCVGGTIYDLSKRSDLRATAMDAVAAEDEVIGIGERNQRTVRLNAERGRPHGPILFGYKRRYDPDTGDLIDQIPHPKYAKVVKEIFRRIAEGDSAYSIARDLQARKLNAPGRERWDGARMVEIAKNPSYLGRRKYRGEVIGKATWKPLIEPELWRRVQLVLSNPARRMMPDTMVKHLLSGIARCGECSDHCPLRVLSVRSGRHTYNCKGCFCVSMVEPKLDAYVTLALLEWLSKPEARAILIAPPADEDAYSAALLELESLQAELATARALVGHRDPAKRLTIASLAAAEAGLQPLIDEKATEVDRLAPSPSVPVLDDLLGAPDVEERWERLTMEKKRVVLRATASIQLNKGRKGSSAIQEGRVAITFGPQPNERSPMARVQ